MNNSALPVWVRSRAQQHINGNPDFPTDESGPQHPYKPGFVFEAGIRPLLQMAVKGILCYQGESNAQEPERVQEYAMLGKLMVDDWRIRWKQPEMPFYYVQLSSIDTLQYRSQLWPLFRDEQRKMLALIPFSGMAVSSDLGAKNDVHPVNKKDIGERLAAWALNKTYHQKISYSGPVPLTAIYKKGKVIVTFKYTRSGLQTKDDQPVQGFSTDGIHQVPVLIRKKRVIVRARLGDLGIIPGSMGQKSYIVRGKGNLESYCSCSHGAGRTMSRAEAKRRFSLVDLVAQTEGVECRKDADVIDEIPGAYKDLDLVMENQKDLVEVVHTLRAVLCVKGN